MKKYIDREALAADGWYLQRHINRDGHACVECMNILDIPAADVVTWDWLKRYAHGKGMQNTSMFIFEAMDEWGKENQG